MFRREQVLEPKHQCFGTRGNAVLVVLLLCSHLVSVTGDPTSCDGNDSTVPNCCQGEGQRCFACKAGYGLVKNTCQKCVNPKCAYCNGDSKTCKASDMYVGDIPHCQSKDFTSCYEVCRILRWYTKR